VASFVYRWCVVFGILWFCYQFLKPYRLEVVAQALILAVVVGLVGVPAGGLALLLRDPAWQRRIHWGRTALTGGLLLAAIFAVSLIPLPFRVTAPAVLQPEGAHYVYVVVPGTLAESASVGEAAEEGQELARLVNLDVLREIAELTGKRDQQQSRLENLQVRLADDPSVAPQIPAAKEALSDIEEQLRKRQRDAERLVLQAPASGTVLPPPRRPVPSYAPGRLPSWQGSPLDEMNRGVPLETGTLFCLIGDPDRLEAFLVLDQGDVKFVRKGQRVRLKLDELPGRILQGTISEIAKTDLKVAPRELATGKELALRVDEAGIPRPTETSYQARVALDEHGHRLLTGTGGRAKILVDRQSLGRRLSRSLSRTFNFRW
jgi:putative peptide zinc metalloprotease protein